VFNLDLNLAFDGAIVMGDARMFPLQSHDVVFMLDNSRSHHDGMGKKQNDAFHAIARSYADFECHVIIVESFCRHDATRGEGLRV